MGTRATVHFHHAEEKTPSAIVYRHYDGYVVGLGADLFRFFEDVKAQTKDTRFGDPSYLAAKFMVWQARESAKTYDPKTRVETSHANERPLDFLSVGILLEDPDDIEFRYHVLCGSGEPPEVRFEERGGWDPPKWTKWTVLTRKLIGKEKARIEARLKAAVAASR
ncbi:MAG: hypothetical protein L0216_09175 [Planctomycetales bacterium]|nr:hypothetical protein [Planctomycetales bacterium]